MKRTKRNYLVLSVILFLFMLLICGCASQVRISVHSLNNGIEDFTIKTRAGADLTKWAYGDPHASVPEGLIFDAYYEDANMSRKINLNRAPDRDMDIYIHYKKAEVTLNILPIGTQAGFIQPFTITAAPGTGLSQYYKGDPNATIEKGWSFAGYYLDEDRQRRYDMTVMPDDDLTLYIYYTVAVRVELSFETYGVDNISPIQDYQGSEVILPTLSKYGYNFGGWYYDPEYNEKAQDNFILPDHDVTLYAKWDRKEGFHIVSYYVNSVKIDDVIVPEGAFVRGYDFEDEDIIVEGWYLSENMDYENRYDFDLRIDQDIKLYANAYTRGLEVSDGVVLGIANNNIKQIYIPSFYEGTLVTEIADSAFQGSSMTEVYLSNTIRKISDNAFYACKQLKTVLLNEGLVEIGKEAFAQCTALRTITIPASVTFIDDIQSVFSFCLNLQSVNIASGNRSYMSDSGNVYDVSGKSLIYAATGKRIIEVADGTETIVKGAIDSINIEEVIIPAGVTEIERGAISPKCTSLNSLTLPALANSEVAIDTGSYLIFNLAQVFGAETYMDNVTITEGQITEYSLIVPISLSSVTINYISPAANLAYSFFGCSNIRNIILPERGLKEIGIMAFGYCMNLREITIPDTVVEIAGGSNASFYGTISLTSLTVPFIGGSIYKNNFLAYIFGAENYTDQIYISEEENRQYVPASLQTVTVTGGRAQYGNLMDSVGEGAFYHSANIQKIVLPENINSIGYDAFRRCINLRRLVNITSEGVESEIFYRITTLSAMVAYDEASGTYSSYSGAFAECINLRGLGLPDLRGEVPDLAFAEMGMNVPEFTKFTLGKKVTKLGNRVFYGCRTLQEIVIENNDSVLEWIGGECFSGCSMLRTIKIPATVKRIPSVMFEGCDNLESISMPMINNAVFVKGNAGEPLEYVNIFHFGVLFGASAIDEDEEAHGSAIVPASLKTVIFNAAIGEPYLYYTFYDCRYIESIKLPLGAIKIGEFAFYDCRQLRDLKIPSTVAEIEAGAFAFNFSLNGHMYDGAEFVETNGVLYDKSMTRLISYPAGKTDREFIIPDSVTEICSFAFAGAVGLSKLTLPESIIKIGGNAFNDCPALKEFSFKGASKYIYQDDALLSSDGKILYQFLGEGNYIVPESVTQIAEYAFADNKNIKNIILGKNIASIGAYAFKNITANITFENDSAISEIGEAAFAHYAGSAIIIPASVKHIGDDAFAFSTITRIVFEAGGGVLTIGKRAFFSASVRSIILPSTLIKIGDYAFYHAQLTSVSFPSDSSLSEIGDYAFARDAFLTKFEFSKAKGLTSVGDYAFCLTGLTEIDLLATGLSRVGNYAFYYTDASRISLPPTLKEWGEYAFGFNWALETIYLSSGITEIGDYAFIANTVLYDADHPVAPIEKIEIPASVEKIGKYSFYQVGFYMEYRASDGNYYYHYDRSVSLSIASGSSLTEIGEYAFGNTLLNVGLRLDLSGTRVKSIGEGAFACAEAAEALGGFSELALPETLVIIGKDAFKDNTALNDLHIPASVTEIGAFAFSGNLGLHNISFGSEYNKSKLESIAGGSFASCNANVYMYVSKVPRITAADDDAKVAVDGLPFDYKCRLFVPDGLKTEFLNSPYWQPYADRIYSI